MDGLEVLCLSGSRGDGHLLCTDEGVNSRRLSDVRVSDESNLRLPCFVRSITYVELARLVL
jgi:hypothetical protein